MRIILASGSPRRRDLLSREGISYEVIVSDADEHTDETDPHKAAEEIALRKARAVCDMLKETMTAQAEDCLIISADTMVVLDDRILGKPADEANAYEMLRGLSGRAHEVVTGVGLIRYFAADGRFDEESFHEVTKVFVKDITEEQIRKYIASGEPMDKAGAYGIQGAFGRYIERIEGDYDNVVGLPVKRLLEYL